MSRSLRLRNILPLALLLLAVVGCSPEGERARSGGSGADIGNRGRGVTEMHGNRQRNNPDYLAPKQGRVPNDAKGIMGWWANRAR